MLYKQKLNLTFPLTKSRTFPFHLTHTHSNSKNSIILGHIGSVKSVIKFKWAFFINLFRMAKSYGIIESQTYMSMRVLTFKLHPYANVFPLEGCLYHRFRHFDIILSSSCLPFHLLLLNQMNSDLCIMRIEKMILLMPKCLWQYALFTWRFCFNKNWHNKALV